MYTGLGAVVPQTFGIWTIKPESGSVLDRWYLTLHEILFSLPADKLAQQTDFTTWELRVLWDNPEFRESIWPIWNGPWKSQWNGYGATPYGTYDNPTDPNFVLADRTFRQQRDAVYLPPAAEVAPGSLPFVGAYVNPEYIAKGGNYQDAAGNVVDYAGNIVTPAETAGIDQTILERIAAGNVNTGLVPGGGVVQPGLTQSPNTVVSPTLPSGAAPDGAGAGFPTWGYIAIGIGAYALLSRR